tara:strand:- start:199 stop:537 length:339 start_codon:yes stop_codon:yes gene_type:complete
MKNEVDELGYKMTLIEQLRLYEEETKPQQEILETMISNIASDVSSAAELSSHSLDLASKTMDKIQSYVAEPDNETTDSANEMLTLMATLSGTFHIVKALINCLDSQIKEEGN